MIHKSWCRTSEWDGNCNCHAAELAAAEAAERAVTSLRLQCDTPQLQIQFSHLPGWVETGPLFYDTIRDAISHLDLTPIMRALIIENAGCAVRHAVRDALRKGR